VPTTEEKQKSEKRMASDVITPGADEGGNRPQPRGDTADRGGFFHVYKRGQGYWTRVGSAAAAGLIVLLTLEFLYTHLNVWLTPDNATVHQVSMAKLGTLAICGAFLLASAILVFYLLNKPDYADFLIATDSEMKKVNWTSRRELIGSTKVVIVFMFLIASLLFLFDLFFGYLFYAMTVLKTKPL
jgi:preprotein translocase subunit SecE